MRVSRYNIYTKLKNYDRKWLLIQGTRGSFDIVDEEIANTLIRGENEPATLSVISDGNIEVLKKRGYITDITEEEEFAFVDKISLAMNTVARRGISVALLPTYNCNFRCEYCFEKNYKKKVTKYF